MRAPPADSFRGDRQSVSLPADESPFDPTGPRFIIEDIFPSLDGGRFAIKRVAGEPIDVWCDILRDGHDLVAAAVLWKSEGRGAWHRVPMALDVNDRWHAQFAPADAGNYVYCIEAWTDRFGTWRKEALLKQGAGQDISLEAREGRELLDDVSTSDPGPTWVIEQARGAFDRTSDVTALLSETLQTAASVSQSRADATRSVMLPLVIDRPIARHGAWYEMVPRSQAAEPGKHGTFDDCIARIPDVASLGFDVLYFTPIHPIGMTNRKGRNNATKAQPGDPGSPYAIGSKDGGHDAVHPELGTLDDFRRLVGVAKQHGMEVALDFAIQCSPDHPWLKEHPEWFRRRPDGSIRYAENPPKKYEDIVNPDFYCADRIGLWRALRDVILFWVEQGVTIFRVDNPHTKPFPFWEWLIHEVQLRAPGTIFLAEAFTRPKIMKGLAKLGFTQSYTYFTWRTHKVEIQEYLSELSRHPEREFYRPNFFVTTPDILPVQLQTGEVWMFKSRAALAATLSSNYGIYNGYELLEHEPIPGKEEYLNSEKYELKPRDWTAPNNIRSYLQALNMARRENAALQQTSNVQFAQIDDEQVIGFVKESVDGENAVAVAIALSGDRPRQFWFHFGDIQVGPPNARQPVKQLENLKTRERLTLEWGGVRLTIDPLDDPALLFKCI